MTIMVDLEIMNSKTTGKQVPIVKTSVLPRTDGM